MTGREFVDSIYAKLGMIRPKEEKKRLAWLHGVGELFAVPPIRRIAIAVLVVILMTVFFAATPAGRAVAESVIQYVINLFDSKKAAVTTGEGPQSIFIDLPEELIPDFARLEDKQPKKIDSVEQFAAEYGRTPLMLSLSVQKVTYTDHEDGEISLIVVYRTDDGGKIVTVQRWNADAELLVWSTADLHLNESDPLTIYSADAEKGDAVCILLLEDSFVFIYVNDTVSKEEIIEWIKP